MFCRSTFYSPVTVNVSKEKFTSIRHFVKGKGHNNGKTFYQSMFQSVFLLLCKKLRCKTTTTNNLSASSSRSIYCCEIHMFVLIFPSLLYKFPLFAIWVKWNMISLCNTFFKFIIFILVSRYQISDRSLFLY